MGRRKSNTQPTVVSDHDRFWNLMTMPLYTVSDEDLEWASKQDQLNSYASKCVWLSEIKRRKNNEKHNRQCSTQKQQ